MTKQRLAKRFRAHAKDGLASLDQMKDAPSKQEKAARRASLRRASSFGSRSGGSILGSQRTLELANLNFAQSMQAQAQANGSPAFRKSTSMASEQMAFSKPFGFDDASPATTAFKINSADPTPSQRLKSALNKSNSQRSVQLQRGFPTEEEMQAARKHSDFADQFESDGPSASPVVRKDSPTTIKAVRGGNFSPRAKFSSKPDESERRRLSSSSPQPNSPSSPNQEEELASSERESEASIKKKPAGHPGQKKPAFDDHAAGDDFDVDSEGDLSNEVAGDFAMQTAEEEKKQTSRAPAAAQQKPQEQQREKTGKGAISSDEELPSDDEEDAPVPQSKFAKIKDEKAPKFTGVSALKAPGVSKRASDLSESDCLTPVNDMTPKSASRAKINLAANITHTMDDDEDFARAQRRGSVNKPGKSGMKQSPGKETYPGAAKKKPHSPPSGAHMKNRRGSDSSSGSGSGRAWFSGCGMVWGMLKEYALGWRKGYMRRWIVGLWTLLIGYAIAVLLVVQGTLRDFGTFQEDMTLTQKLNFQLQSAGMLVPDVVTYDRMPWRTDQTPVLRNKFDSSIGIASDMLSELIPNDGSTGQSSQGSTAFRYPARRELLFTPGCLRKENDCSAREGEADYEGHALMEQGLYRSTLEFIRHCREIRQFYKRSELSALSITSDEPADYWFIRNALVMDLSQGLERLIDTYLKEATETQVTVTNEIWAVCGGGIGCVGISAIVCFFLLSWQWQQVEDVLTTLRLLPWEDVRNQTVLESAKMAQSDDAVEFPGGNAGKSAAVEEDE